ncbi:MAG: hypothetical protein BWY21_00959 [Parcubacteria group bacterium ADurb.Bin216]|nr:MAG: hypothetical protein BWY21_00959 [Parcubacteria group bacterium ADurb.Bin216]
MRLWSIHPVYLDDIGLSRCYYEGIGGLKTMLGMQRHPQLNRFKQSKDPVNNLKYYLIHVYTESVFREKDYKHFELLEDLCLKSYKPDYIPVSNKQLEFEIRWLVGKMSTERCYNSHQKIERLMYDYQNKNISSLTHHLFNVVDGEIEDWERSHLDKEIVR